MSLTIIQKTNYVAQHSICFPTLGPGCQTGFRSTKLEIFNPTPYFVMKLLKLKSISKSIKTFWKTNKSWENPFYQTMKGGGRYLAIL